MNDFAPGEDVSNDDIHCSSKEAAVLAIIRKHHNSVSHLGVQTHLEGVNSSAIYMKLSEVS